MNKTDRRLTTESMILAIVSAHGGERIEASPQMERLVSELADWAEREAPFIVEDLAASERTDEPGAGEPGEGLVAALPDAEPPLTDAAFMAEYGHEPYCPADFMVPEGPCACRAASIAGEPGEGT